MAFKLWRAVGGCSKVLLTLLAVQAAGWAAEEAFPRLEALADGELEGRYASEAAQDYAEDFASRTRRADADNTDESSERGREERSRRSEDRASTPRLFESEDDSRVYPASHSAGSCRSCGQSSGECSCGPVLPGTPCPRTNLFWCSPYGDLVNDPCDREACRECEVSGPVRWYATAELLPLYRDQKDDVNLQTLDDFDGTILDTGDFDTEFDAGMRLVIGAALNDVYRLEGGYIGPHEWSSRIVAPDGSVAPLADMATKFSSYEMNLRRRILIPRDPWPGYNHLCVANSFLVGGRYLNLDETLAFGSNVATSNDMLGLQVGMLSQFLTHRHGWIDLEVKGGMYNNQMRLNVLDTTASVQEADRTAFLGELSLSYNYQLSRHLAFRAGYNAFWLTGVALASQNLPLSGTVAPVLNHNGDMVFHGPNVGLTYAW